jgi:hypothetical protein
MPAAQQTCGRVNMQPPSLMNIYPSRSFAEMLASAASRAFRLRSAGGGSVLPGCRSRPVCGLPKGSTVEQQLLKRPGVAVGVAEGDERAVKLNVNVAGLRAVLDKVSPRVSTSARTHYAPRREPGA